MLRNLNASVPQGSVIGLMLYNIFTSNLLLLEEVKVAINKIQYVLDKTYTWISKRSVRASAQTRKTSLLR